MASETDIQAEIKWSVRRDGGYCHKLTNRFTVGIPDLLIALPPFVPCIIEVKDEGDCSEGFDRKLDVTTKQRYELNAITDVYGWQGAIVSGVFVHLNFQPLVSLVSGRVLVALPRDATRITARALVNPGSFRKRIPVRRDDGKYNHYWEVRPLLHHLGIRKC